MRDIFCDGKTEAQAAGFARCHERPKQILPHSGRNARTIVFYENVNRLMILTQCDFHFPWFTSLLRGETSVQQQIVNSTADDCSIEDGPGRRQTPRWRYSLQPHVGGGELRPLWT